jgi:hypothetical protein
VSAVPKTRSGTVANFSVPTAPLALSSICSEGFYPTRTEPIETGENAGPFPQPTPEADARRFGGKSALEQLL